MKNNFNLQCVSLHFVQWLATLIFCSVFCLPKAIVAQAPEFSYPVQSPFNLHSGNYDGATVKLADLDHDDVLEAVVWLSNNTSREIWYFENDGDNEAPAFVFETSAPFGIPVEVNRPFQFVDIDGDGLDDLFFAAVVHYANPIHMIKNTGDEGIPNFANPYQLNPFGISLPRSDEDNSLLDGAVPSFADIDNDGDFDLFLGGAFDNGEVDLSDEALFFLENVDASGNGIDPQFDTIVKNPFGFVLPPGTEYHWEIFADMDCDGDLDMYLAAPPGNIYYFENTGTPEIADFSGGGVNYIPTAPQGYFNPPAGSFLDVDGDGDLDLIGGSQFWGIQFFENITIAPDFSRDSNGLNVIFTDESQGNPTEWSWDFGDGGTSTEQHPSHTYSDYGTYEVCLTVAKASACPTIACEDLMLISTNLQEIGNNNVISLVPNPVEEELKLFISSDASLNTVKFQIYDTYGKRIATNKTETLSKELSKSIDASHLPAGIYFLTLRLGERMLIRRFVKI